MIAYKFYKQYVSNLYLKKSNSREGQLFLPFFFVQYPIIDVTWPMTSYQLTCHHLVIQPSILRAFRWSSGRLHLLEMEPETHRPIDPLDGGSKKPGVLNHQWSLAIYPHELHIDHDKDLNICKSWVYNIWKSHELQCILYSFIHRMMLQDSNH